MSAARLRRIKASLAICLLPLLLVSCGGGADGTGAPIGFNMTFSSGVLATDPIDAVIVVNDISYTDSEPLVVDDLGRSASQLAAGMRVKLRARKGPDGTGDAADIIKIEPTLRGVVDRVENPARKPVLVVGGLRISMDDETILAGADTIRSLVGAWVEVHGLADPAGDLRASRVEVLATRLATSLAGRDLYRGAIAAVLPDGAVQVGALELRIDDVAPATFVPEGCGRDRLLPGREIAAYGAFGAAGKMVAVRIECEDLSDEASGLQPAAGSRASLEGFVTTLDFGNATFSIGERTVSIPTDAKFLRGEPGDLAVGVKVVVDGTFDGTAIVARKVAFANEQMVIQGTIEALTEVPPLSIEVLGLTILLQDSTQVTIGRPLVPGTSVRVLALQLADGSLVATRVLLPDGEQEVLRGPVDAKTEDSLTVLGVTLSLPEDAEYQLSAGSDVVSREAFLEAIVAGAPGASTVRAQGSALTSDGRSFTLIGADDSP
jgi:hypothetical protein